MLTQGIAEVEENESAVCSVPGNVCPNHHQMAEGLKRKWDNGGYNGRPRYFRLMIGELNYIFFYLLMS